MGSWSHPICGVGFLDGFASDIGESTYGSELWYAALPHDFPAVMGTAGILYGCHDVSVAILLHVLLSYFDEQYIDSNITESIGSSVNSIDIFSYWENGVVCSR